VADPRDARRERSEGDAVSGRAAGEGQRFAARLYEARDGPQPKYKCREDGCVRRGMLGIVGIVVGPCFKLLREAWLGHGQKPV